MSCKRTCTETTRSCTEPIERTLSEPVAEEPVYRKGEVEKINTKPEFDAYCAHMAATYTPVLGRGDEEHTQFYHVLYSAPEPKPLPLYAFGFLEHCAADFSYNQFTELAKFDEYTVRVEETSQHGDMMTNDATYLGMQQHFSGEKVCTMDALGDLCARFKDRVDVAARQRNECLVYKEKIAALDPLNTKAREFFGDFTFGAGFLAENIEAKEYGQAVALWENVKDDMAEALNAGEMCRWIKKNDAPVKANTIMVRASPTVDPCNGCENYRKCFVLFQSMDPTFWWVTEGRGIFTRVRTDALFLPNTV